MFRQQLDQLRPVGGKRWALLPIGGGDGREKGAELPGTEVQKQPAQSRHDGHRVTVCCRQLDRFRWSRIGGSGSLACLVWSGWARLAGGDDLRAGRAKKLDPLRMPRLGGSMQKCREQGTGKRKNFCVECMRAHPSQKARWMGHSVFIVCRQRAELRALEAGQWVYST